MPAPTGMTEVAVLALTHDIRHAWVNSYEYFYDEFASCRDLILSAQLSQSKENYSSIEKTLSIFDNSIHFSRKIFSIHQFFYH